jgi:hypothetical protein
MVRFIFVCMGVVALSILTLAAQFMMDGIEGAKQQVAARNDEAPAPEVMAVESEITAEQLNAIETAAGADAAINAPGNQTFGDAFTADAPKALKEPTPMMEADIFPTEGTAQ